MNKSAPPPAQPHPLIIAHRGASHAAPENTLAAIREALRIGADLVEIDVHQTQDGQVVVLHDDDLDRTTSGTGRIGEKSWAEVQPLDAGSWFSEKFKGEKVPLLEEVLQLVNGQAQLLIEVKAGSSQYPGIEANVLRLIRQSQAQSWCILQSFEDEVLENLHQLNPALPLHKLVVGELPLLPLHIDNSLRTGHAWHYGLAAAINPHYRLVTKRFVDEVHLQGKKVFVWTVDQPNDMRKMLQLGVDGIITNRPELLKELIVESL